MPFKWATWRHHPYVNPAFSEGRGRSNTKRGEQNQKWLPHPCILGPRDDDHGVGEGGQSRAPRSDPGGREVILPPPGWRARPGAARRGAHGHSHPGGMFGQGATAVVDPDWPARYPPPPPPGWCGVDPPALHSAEIMQNDPPQRPVTPVPRPFAAVPVPDGPARDAAVLPQPPAGLGAADAPLGGAGRPGTGPPPLNAHVSRALPPRRQRSEGILAAVTCALHALEGPAPRLLRLEDILMGCFLHRRGTGANPRWQLPSEPFPAPPLFLMGGTLQASGR